MISHILILKPGSFYMHWCFIGFFLSVALPNCVKWRSLHTKSYFLWCNKEPTCWETMGMLHFRVAGEHTPSRLITQRGHIRISDAQSLRACLRIHSSVCVRFHLYKQACVTETKVGGCLFLRNSFHSLKSGLGRHRQRVGVSVPDLSHRTFRRWGWR